MANQKKADSEQKANSVLRPEYVLLIIAVVYLLYTICTPVMRKRPRVTTVEPGEIVSNHYYTGIVLRDEQIETAPRGGYPIYYLQEGKRAAVGNRIYALSATDVTPQLASNLGGNAPLGADNIHEIKNRLSAYRKSYDRDQYAQNYTAENSIQSLLSSYASLSLLGNLDEEMKKQGIELTDVTSPLSGVVSFRLDNYSTVTEDNITAALFDQDTTSAAADSKKTFVNAGDPVYRIVPSEEWKVVFPLDKKESRENTKSLRVSFMGSNISMSGDYHEITGKDEDANQRYGVLTFQRYMIQFLEDRFVKFRIVEGRKDGLKIQKTALTKKKYYAIPLLYLTRGGANNGNVVHRLQMENGEEQAVDVPVTVVHRDDTYFYVSMDENASLKEGDWLINDARDQKVQVGETGELPGVYSVTGGVAVFRKVEIIEENDEYAIVHRGISGSINPYDRILLNGSEGREGEMVY